MIKSRILVITGGIGTGKSTVLNLFKNNNFNIVNCDNEVTELFKSTYSKYHELAQTYDDFLGSQFRHSDIIDKKELRKLLEKKENGFLKSMEIVKPHISERLDYLEKHLDNSNTVFEIPLLFEAGMDNKYENIILVCADLDIRIKRIMNRQPELSIDQINNVINLQMADSYKINKSKFIISNNGDLKDLEIEFNLLLNKLKINTWR